MTATIFRKVSMTQTTRTILSSCMPMMLLVAWFVFVALINWDYQVKFFEPALIGGQTDEWIGPKLLSISVVFGIASSAFVFFALRQRAAKQTLYFVLSLLVSVLLCLMGLAFLLLGPATITMMEQMKP